jgi:transcriptional regulator with XRE-family HTH domain
MKNLGKNITAYRNAITMSVDTLARLLGVDAKTVERWERGTLAPTDKEIYYIACALNISEDTLRGNTPPPPTPPKDEGVLGQPDGIYGESEEGATEPEPAPEDASTSTDSPTLLEMRRLLEQTRERETAEPTPTPVFCDECEGERFPNWFPVETEMGERMLWSGKPSTDSLAMRRARKTSIALLIISIATMLFSITSRSTSFLIILGIVGVYLCTHRLNSLNTAANGTHYALTNKRLVIISGKKYACFAPSEVRYCATVGKDAEGYASVMMASSAGALEGKKLPFLSLGNVKPNIYYINDSERLIRLIGGLVRKEIN